VARKEVKEVKEIKEVKDRRSFADKNAAGFEAGS
jgi:hypothetical protein